MMTTPAEVVIATPEELADCCAALARSEQVGLDTEFVGEDTYHPSLCLVQVATHEALYLIDPFIVGPLDAFWQTLLDPAKVVVLHAGREEVRLCHRQTGQAPPNLFDLQIAAGFVGHGYPLGYGPLVHQLLGKSMSKGETLTEWRSRPLTKSQLRYAFDDVRYLLPLWQRLHEKLNKQGRSTWALEEFARMRAVFTPSPEAPTQADRWRKLRGLGGLDRRRLALARALYEMRDALAEENNRPSRTILRDDLVVEIARRNPKSPQDLQVMRGMARRFVAPLWQALEKARALSPDECPAPTEREQELPQQQLLVSILSAALADFCARERLAAGLVANNQDLRLLVRARLQDESEGAADSPLSHGWRAAHILPHLQALLDGRRALRVADVRSDSPFTYIDL